MGIPVRRHRIVATTIGGALAGLGGSHLTLYFPGIWSGGRPDVSPPPNGGRCTPKS